MREQTDENRIMDAITKYSKKECVSFQVVGLTDIWTAVIAEFADGKFGSFDVYIDKDEDNVVIYQV